MTSRANVIGTGLIGGSVGIALRANGWFVTATDSDTQIAEDAVKIGAADEVGLNKDADVTVIATPVGDIAGIALDALGKTTGAVTDVGSTKFDICTEVAHPRFVGGHPMAGSEQDGLAGARGSLFEGAMWVLTPTEETNEDTFATVRSMVRLIGAETIALHPRSHDQMVAQVSHVPHLTAAALMCLADDSSIEHRALLRLAAGGFRDMTRISAGRPTIWPDICAANRTAIVDGLDQLIQRLGDIKERVATQDQVGILDLLTRARTARVNLPTGYGIVDAVAEVTVPIPDRPGEIAVIATLAAELDVNILDLNITHTGEGKGGVMMMVVDESQTERLLGGLMARGYHPQTRALD